MHELEISTELILGPLIDGGETMPSGKPWCEHEWRQSIAATWC
jgi:hypothetical protein